MSVVRIHPGALPIRRSWCGVPTKRAVEKHINSIFLKLDLRDSEDVSRRVTAALMLLAESES